MLLRPVTAPSTYSDWKAPDDDGQMLIWPEQSRLLSQSRANHELLSKSKATMQNLPLGQLRYSQRQWLGHFDDDMPLIATGHQTELYHPGVWVKDVLISSLAKRLGGRAIHFAVDTDAPRHFHLRWPGGSKAMTEDPRLLSAAWAGLLNAPSASHLDDIREEFDSAQAGWGFESMVDDFLVAMRGHGQLDLPQAVTKACSAVNRGLGVLAEDVIVSPMWYSPGFLTFAHHFLARAGSLAGDYNKSLADYRVEQGISSPGRPMPDLDIAADRVESPFWLDDLSSGKRQRLFLVRQGEFWTLRDFRFDPGAQADDAARELEGWLTQSRLRLAPRALMLTLFLRVLVADEFVHGIGGGRYDQVTDHLIRRQFGIAPPGFSVTTATLYFPTAQGQHRVNLRPLLQEGRRLRHGSFWLEKREMAQRIATAPRLSRQRRDLFYAMHSKLAEHANSRQMKQWAAELEEAVAEQARQKVMFDRELFYAIQPPRRLQYLIARYDASLQ